MTSQSQESKEVETKSRPSQQIKGSEYRRTEDYENSSRRGFVLYNQKTGVVSGEGEIIYTLFGTEKKYRQACGIADLFGGDVGEIKVAEVIELANGNFVKVDYPVSELTGEEA